MSNTLIFDLGGVLVANDMFTELKTLMATDASDATLKSKWLRSSAVREFELGQCSPEDFAAVIVEEFGIQATPQEFLDAFTLWPKGLYPEAANFLAQLREQYSIACLSNSNAVHWTEQITAHFDYAYSSHLINKIKPDKAVFEFVTEALDVEPNEIMFFDDAQLNVDAALAFGWNAYLTLGFSELTRIAKGIGLGVCRA